MMGTKQTYMSSRPSAVPQVPIPTTPGIKSVPQIQRFTPDSIIFDDDTTLTHIDTIILTTGYNYLIPYLTAGGHLTVTTPSKVADDN
jgi:Flavin-binding monooxygenase-like